MIKELIAQRVKNLPPYLFVGISRKIQAKRACGADIISFAIGDPDIPTPQHIIDRLCETAKDPENHRYPETCGMPETRRAIAGWYARRFGVALDPDTEILPLIGEKEGIGHIAFCFIDPSDIVLMTDPCYPVYPASTILAGGEPYYLSISPANNYLPDMDNIPDDILRRAKLLWLNYPNNPTGAVCDLRFFQKVVDFAQKHRIAVCHDNPYSEVTYDGYVPNSFLETAGAKDIGVEFHSVSKTYNMTGWRFGFVVGNAIMIETLMRLKSNLDSGIPQAIQHMAIEALRGPQDCIQEHNDIYRRRRDLMVETLNKIGLHAAKPQATLYVWAKVPEHYTSIEFTDSLLEDTGVVVTPGTGYGKTGEGYIRLSLTVTDAEFYKGLDRLAAWRNKK